MQVIKGGWYNPPAMSRLIAAVEGAPQRAFVIILAVHFFVWTALPALLYANLPLDLIEALTYGREWQLGYDKLPPLPWWIVEIVYRLIGYEAAYYALAQLAVIAAFALVFLTARPLIGDVRAILAVLIIDGLHYFHYTAAKFNHDVIQLPLWALAGYAFHAALKRGHLGSWLLLGLAIGLSLWAKYFVVMLAFPLALFLVLDREARRSLATPGPWLALALALLIMAPHLVWLVQNDFLPFAYAERRAAPSRGLIDHVIHPLVFAASQVVFLVPALAIAAALFIPPPKGEGGRAKRGGVGELGGINEADAFDRRIVSLLAFGPAATVIALSAISGRGTIAMWGYPLWLFLGLWMLLAVPSALAPARFARALVAWAAVFSIFALAFIANYTVLPAFDHRYRAAFYPGERLADEIALRFRVATGAPLTYVIASMWDGGNVAHYAREHPRVLIDGDPRRAPWIDLGDLRSKGAVVLWTDADPSVIPLRLRGVGGDAQVQPPFAIPFRRGDHVLTVGWAILRPSPAFASHPGLRSNRAAIGANKRNAVRHQMSTMMIRMSWKPAIRVASSPSTLPVSTISAMPAGAVASTMVGTE
jgi:Dolichyl-phosphate-mannose-protein mannosyltransferase